MGSVARRERGRKSEGLSYRKDTRVSYRGQHWATTSPTASRIFSRYRDAEAFIERLRSKYEKLGRPLAFVIVEHRTALLTRWREVES